MATVMPRASSSHRTRFPLGVALVTSNEADFVNHSGLVVENWVNNY